jgi:hypothetical protein
MSWFGTDQGKAANTLFKRTRLRFTEVEIRDGLADCSAFHRPLLPPYELCRLLALPTLEAVQATPKVLSQWDWESALLRNVGSIWPEDDEDSRKRKLAQHLPSLWAIMEIKNVGERLLLYAQRAYLRTERRFRDYDPARKDLWEAHNRPWDFDHIFPYYYTYYQQGPFRPFCAKWVSLVGNLRAWPFEENRSDQKDRAGDKIHTDVDAASSFLTQEELCGFNQDAMVRDDPLKALAFVAACRARTVRIYSEWYNTLDIQTLADIKAGSPNS